MGADELLLQRARRFRRRGEHRRAMLTLREACFAAASDGRLWTLYAAQCLRAGRADEAERALAQALWYRRRDHDQARARVTERLLEQVRAGRRDLPLRAA